jgi:hypothetical protein
MSCRVPSNLQQCVESDDTKVKSVSKHVAEKVSSGEGSDRASVVWQQTGSCPALTACPQTCSSFHDTACGTDGPALWRVETLHHSSYGSPMQCMMARTIILPHLLKERSRYSSCASTANSGRAPLRPLLLMLRKWMLGGRAGRLPLRLWPDRSRYSSSLQNPRAWGRVPACHAGHNNSRWFAHVCGFAITLMMVVTKSEYSWNAA